MWAVRRASNPLKRGFIPRPARALISNSEISIKYVESKFWSSKYPEVISIECSDLRRFYHSIDFSMMFSMGRHILSSQADAKSSGENDNFDDGFSELETTSSIEKVEEGNIDNANENEFISGAELSEEDDVGDTREDFQSELSDTENEPSAGKSDNKMVSLELTNAILSASTSSFQDVLDKWAEGKNLTNSVIFLVMSNLRKRRMFGKALQFSEWLEANKRVDFAERDYASRVDLIAKVYGPQRAENYIDEMPASFRGELVYRTLLANYVRSKNMKKAEEVFNKMNDLEFPISSFACNQLLLLYKRFDKKKIADVLLLMEKENVKATLFTYTLLIDTKGQSNDISGMEQIFETMKAEGIEPDITTRGVMAKHYTSVGLKEKAEAILKEMEGQNLMEHRFACPALLRLYAELGKADEVARVWKVCAPKPQIGECMAAIEAWGKLNKVEEAEAIFERMSKRWKLYSKNYSKLLRVYASSNMLEKGKDLIRRMADNGCQIGPLTWDALVNLYIQAGEVEKADSILQKAAQQSRVKPLFGSYIALLDQYAKRGDIRNSEKIFYRMKEAGYPPGFRQFQCLIQAYVNARSPAYGMRDRMRAHNVYPNKFLAAQLTLVDAFRKTDATDLLD